MLSNKEAECNQGVVANTYHAFDHSVGDAKTSTANHYFCFVVNTGAT